MENKKSNQTNTEEPLEFSQEEMKMPVENNPETEEQTDQNTEEKHSPLMFIILAVIAISLLLGGGYYIWSTMPSNQPEVEMTPNGEETTSEEEQTEADEEPLNESDEVEAIAEDLENTDFSELDAELDALEAEMDAEFETQ